ncbi:hypothetical protein RHODGE_RHODGE_00848 [Rhodoplanes serenus]|uniref:DUF6538 domain-containing protein n=2 Tax=Nitrobacteraceae TaxID=41294 RepID=A0A3S4AYW9_9BRAD|nr:hypothetical protein RHODGE_RHODGE_00848 [Rhodoplanes serenus]
MGFMTYLIRRGSTWHFRFRLPDDLRGHAVPDQWPGKPPGPAQKKGRAAKPAAQV